MNFFFYCYSFYFRGYEYLVIAVSMIIGYFLLVPTYVCVLYVLKGGVTYNFLALRYLSHSCRQPIVTDALLFCLSQCLVITV